MTNIYNKYSERLKRTVLRNNLTNAEKKLWTILRKRQVLGIKFRRQFSVDKYVLDFYSPEIKLAIEVDGEYHNSKNAMEYDKVRTDIMNSVDITLIRFSNEEVFSDIENVKVKIEEVIEEVKKRLL